MLEALGDYRENAIIYEAGDCITYVSFVLG